uniref:Tryptophan hydroxylase 3 n=1 Tax=Hofstenia miamia TaxID=442651 RepID=A0A7G7LK86_HOFMI|nr:tryptophan hydroxylase 3 [Hofstenia miamia]
MTSNHSQEEKMQSTVIFSLDGHTSMVQSLNIFEDHGIQINRIETRKSSNDANEVEVVCQVEGIKESVTAASSKIKLSSLVDTNSEKALSSNDNEDYQHVWFPSKISELDKVADRIIEVENVMEEDCEGCSYPEYMKRRAMFANIALHYKQGTPIPLIDYLDSEVNTWRVVYKKLQSLYAKYACKEYLTNVRLLSQHCGYNEDNIPQLQHVSQFLKERSGFTLRPVAGYLSARDFLSGLAFRVFNCTQYIRPPSKPFYTREPDCVHELLGHMPLLADRMFAEFSQEIGLASLGASDDEVQKLASLYFFTVEFGLCRQEGKIKAYGAGLLSSAEEFEMAVTTPEKQREFNLKQIMEMECKVTTHQDYYYITNSFDEAIRKLREFTTSMKRPFGVRYDPYTQSIQTIKSTQDIANYVSGIRSDLGNLMSCLGSMKLAN